MHAVVVAVTVHDQEGAMNHLRETVVPTVSQSPGFVAGYWVALGSEKGGRSVLVFESEDAARSAADQVQPAPEGGVTIDDVDVGEVVAHA